MSGPEVDSASESPELGHAWRPLLGAVCWIVAGGLYASWALPPFASLWSDLDGSVFAALNGTLSGDGAWPWICAHLNTRPLDVGWAILMGGLCAAYVVWGGRGTRPRSTRERLAAVGVVAVGVLLGILVAKKVFPSEPRLSPGGVVAGFHDLSARFPEIRPKVATRNSFPGDHAVASFVFLTGFITLVRGRWILPAAVIALLNVSPRLFGGGHWLSDAAVGGGVIGLLVVAPMIALPSVRWMALLTDRLLALAGGSRTPS